MLGRAPGTSVQELASQAAAAAQQRQLQPQTEPVQRQPSGLAFLSALASKPLAAGPVPEDQQADVPSPDAAGPAAVEPGSSPAAQHAGRPAVAASARQDSPAEQEAHEAAAGSETEPESGPDALAMILPGSTPDSVPLSQGEHPLLQAAVQSPDEIPGIDKQTAAAVERHQRMPSAQPIQATPHAPDSHTQAGAAAQGSSVAAAIPPCVPAVSPFAAVQPRAKPASVALAQPDAMQQQPQAQSDSRVQPQPKPGQSQAQQRAAAAVLSGSARPDPPDGSITQAQAEIKPPATADVPGMTQLPVEDITDVLPSTGERSKLCRNELRLRETLSKHLHCGCMLLLI